ncbi:YgfZ/GcvT domain-containing protein [Humitalea sp. 24SJ18S-53]|uniref:CAF17-like 4Fe-4S cluster assembly/insertion protein YgfZ n=1 Tax=Humitalea sp. 24SJ18S-53 TaxID=3422307 RepID=UPI003D66B65D
MISPPLSTPPAGGRQPPLSAPPSGITFDAMTRITPLPDRAVLAMDGEDRVTFLQGLVSADIAAIAPGAAAWAALLTPQGKWIADFFVVNDGARLLLDVEAAQAEAITTRLMRFRLRAKVAMAPTGLAVSAGWDGPAPPGDLCFADPRLPQAGFRILSAEPRGTDPFAAWDAHRIALGLPDGSRDLDAEKSVLLEAGFDELAGVSWTKGCWMGQELTARTKYRGLLKRRLCPVAITGPVPPRGAPLLNDSGAEMGEMRSGTDGIGLALLRLAAIEDGAPLTTGTSRLTPRVPGWMRVLAQPVDQGSLE